MKQSLESNCKDEKEKKVVEKKEKYLNITILEKYLQDKQVK